MKYAILDYGEFVEIRSFDSEPPSLPGKPYREFLPVVREYGEPFTGVENGNWVIRTIDPATLPTPIPQVVSARQARLALLQNDLLATVEQAIASSNNAAIQIEWEYATELRRDNQLVASIGYSLNMTDEQIDQLFLLASTL